MRLFGKPLKRNTVIWTVAVLYLLVHVLVYGVFVLPSFAFRGYGYRDLDWWAYPFLIFAALLPVVWLPKKLERASDFAMWELYATIIPSSVYIPFLSIDRPPIEMTLLTICVIFSFWLTNYVRLHARPLYFARVRNAYSIYQIPFFIVAAMFIVFIWKSVNFRIDLNWATIYTRRAQAAKIAPKGSLLAYAINILVKIINPLGVVLWAIRKSPVHLWMSILGVICAFSFNGLRTAIFLPIFAYLLLRLSRSDKGIPWMLSIIGIVNFLVGMIIFLPSGENIAMDIAAASTVRGIYVTGLLMGNYWDWFTRNPLNMMATSPFFGSLTHPVYKTSIPLLIGYQYFGDPVNVANAHYLASGFAEFSYGGMIAAAIIAGYVFSLFDAMGESRGMSASTICAALLAMQMTNGAIQTTILTGGVLFLLMFLYFNEDAESNPELAREPGLAPQPAT
ncbi:MAG TPA: hypothetical protein VG944_04370 [Fimbriimonas sp.]|nr:hypothetical protein [Fimbriimonas sp.]